MQTVLVLHLGLWLVEGLPFPRIAFSFFCHLVYSLLLRNFPMINVISPLFILSCGKDPLHSGRNTHSSLKIALVLVDHFVWFQYFTTNYYSFGEIASFFGICVWLVPFTYFISLSANDYTLPKFGMFPPNTVNN
jgi:hypothetical protein